MSSNPGVDPQEFGELLESSNVNIDRREPPKVPILVASLYFFVAPVLITVWLTRALQQPDRVAAENFARWLYFPLGDPILILSGIVQAFSGYLVSNDLAIVLSAIPLFLGAVAPAFLQAIIFILAWWGISALVRRLRG